MLKKSFGDPNMIGFKSENQKILKLVSAAASPKTNNIIPQFVPNKPYPKSFVDPFPIKEISQWGRIFTNDERTNYYAISHIVPA